jgi:hypothetical protein
MFDGMELTIFGSAPIYSLHPFGWWIYVHALHRKLPYDAFHRKWSRAIYPTDQRIHHGTAKINVSSQLDTGYTRVGIQKYEFAYDEIVTAGKRGHKIGMFSYLRRFFITIIGIGQTVNLVSQKDLPTYGIQLFK